MTLPNAAVEGFSTNCPEVTPVPESPRLTDGSDASLVNVAVAPNAPAAFGENITLNEALCPDATVTGRLGAVTEKYLLENATLLTVTGLGPEFAANRERVLLLLAPTLPKSSLVALKERVLVGPEPPLALTPWQAVNNARQATTKSADAVVARFFGIQFSAGALSMVT